MAVVGKFAVLIFTRGFPTGFDWCRFSMATSLVLCEFIGELLLLNTVLLFPEGGFHFKM